MVRDALLTACALQCGADVSAVNSQGLTALDIVNMYTDPRSAGQMKQVLQGERWRDEGLGVASYPGPHAERGRGPGDTWQNSRMCSVSIIA